MKNILVLTKSFLPRAIRECLWRAKNQSFFSAIDYIFHFYWEKYLQFYDKIRSKLIKCNCCKSEIRRFVNFIDYDYLPGSKRCPVCGCHSRHRFLHYVLEEYIFDYIDTGYILRFSPEKIFEELILRNTRMVYIGTDITSEYCCTNNIFYIGDAQYIPIKDNSINLVISVHVLEHLKDDVATIHEISRILKMNCGIAIIMVPQSKMKKTIEYSKPNESEYMHYRKYGQDFVNIISSIFHVITIHSTKISCYKELTLEDENIFFCTNSKSTYKDLKRIFQIYDAQP